MKKIKKHEKMNLINCNWLTEEEKNKKIEFISEKIGCLLSTHILYLEKTNVFISYILNINTFNIIINDNVFYTNRIQDITHYIEKEFFKII